MIARWVDYFQYGWVYLGLHNVVVDLCISLRQSCVDLILLPFFSDIGLQFLFAYPLHLQQFLYFLI
jgi:hypothetical protein